MTGQNGDTYEIQADKIGSKSNAEIQIFYKKFNSWIESIKMGSEIVKLDEEKMVNNFIVFSEDGLIMKDLNFHSVKSCKKRIKEDLPVSEKNGTWIYVTMESHVNKSELIEVLEFLKEQRIDYKFGNEDEFVPKIMKQ